MFVITLVLIAIFCGEKQLAQKLVGIAAGIPNRVLFPEREIHFGSRRSSEARLTDQSQTERAEIIKLLQEFYSIKHSETRPESAENEQEECEHFSFVLWNFDQFICVTATANTAFDSERLKTLLEVCQILALADSRELNARKIEDQVNPNIDMPQKEVQTREQSASLVRLEHNFDGFGFFFDILIPAWWWQFCNELSWRGVSSSHSRSFLLFFSTLRHTTKCCSLSWSKINKFIWKLFLDGVALHWFWFSESRRVLVCFLVETRLMNLRFCSENDDSCIPQSAEVDLW